jgi:hypothetical protein
VLVLLSNIDWSGSTNQKSARCTPASTHWHVEIQDESTQFSKSGHLKPSATRGAVDKVLDQHVSNLVAELPDWNSKGFYREPKGIVNGYKD